ncbi:tripartite-type tricarboxylate transporter receptor subunit TctC [Hoeflea marina]|uniref:Tripartite-type tricarboxylate transporter receptor subunit TctC n=1 Tax=Hoeflea marina TaxID=274592 RepID=A0A317PPR2_9HYPH|nr:hypothetical protein [Hoeflea marina]PWW03498.1 tripartite-type tricarboxylate transporter receptor subunit TctC [Hoeflea marina]
MKSSFFQTMLTGLQAAIGVLVLTAPALAEGSVTLKVGYGPGGGYDLMARFVAEHLGGFLPGHPDIVVQNVDGAGSLKLAMMMVGSEPKDGSVIALINPVVAFATVSTPELASFDANSLGWIGSLSGSPQLCTVSRNSPIETVEDFLGRDFILGASGKSSTTYVMAALVKNALHARFSLVTGFKGLAEIGLASERGEIAGSCGNSLTAYTAGGLSQTNRIIGQWALEVPESMKDIPSFLELITDPVDHAAAKLIVDTLRFQHPLHLPPGTPPDIVETYRKAFDAMVADPGFRADAASRKLVLNAKSGETVAGIVRALTGADKAVIDRAGELSK